MNAIEKRILISIARYTGEKAPDSLADFTGFGPGDLGGCPAYVAYFHRIEPDREFLDGTGTLLSVFELDVEEREFLELEHGYLILWSDGQGFIHYMNCTGAEVEALEQESIESFPSQSPYRVGA